MRIVLTREKLLHLSHDVDERAIGAEACEGHDGHGCQDDDRKADRIQNLGVHPHPQDKTDDTEVNAHDAQQEKLDHQASVEGEVRIQHRKNQYHGENQGVQKDLYQRLIQQEVF